MTDIHVLGIYEKLRVFPVKDAKVYERGYFLVDSGKPLLEARLFEGQIIDNELRPTNKLADALRSRPDLIQVYQGNDQLFEMRVSSLTRFRAPSHQELGTLAYQICPSDVG